MLILSSFVFFLLKFVILNAGSFNHPPNRQAIKYLLTMLPNFLGNLPPKEQETFLLHIISSNFPKDFDSGFDDILLKKVRFHRDISRHEVRFILL